MYIFHVIPNISEGIPVINGQIVSVSPYARTTKTLDAAIRELAAYQWMTENYDSGIRLEIV